MGVTTHALYQALACLQDSAFGTPGLGVLPAPRLSLKLPVSVETAAEAREFSFCCFFVGSDFRRRSFYAVFYCAQADSAGTHDRLRFALTRRGYSTSSSSVVIRACMVLPTGSARARALDSVWPANDSIVTRAAAIVSPLRSRSGKTTVTSRLPRTK